MYTRNQNNTIMYREIDALIDGGILDAIHTDLFFQ